MTAKVCGKGRDVVRIPHLFEVVDLDQVGVARSGHDLRFLHESLQGRWIRDRGQDELLDRDLTPEPWLFGQVDGAHPAAT